MWNILGAAFDYINTTKERKKRNNQMEKDLIRFWQTFDELPSDDQKGIFEVATLLSKNWWAININLDDKNKETKIKEMTNILTNLPRKRFITIYNLLKEKAKTQETLASALLPDTEREDAPEGDENEHSLGIDSEKIPQDK